MNSALIIGVILIIAGIALAVVAYLVITSDDEDDEETEQLQPDQPVDQAPMETEAAIVSATDDAEEEAESAADPDIELSPSMEPAVIDEVEEETEAQTDDDIEDPSEDASAEAPTRAPEHIQVATLLRDDVTGKLIIRVGDNEYSSPDELRASSDWTRIEYAASDLNKWLESPKEKTQAGKDSGTEVEGQVSERKPSTMIEQINAILQERIETSGRSELAVRLIEGPGGMARVLIGVHSYEITEVPDPEVRELIREAVATWESTQ